MPSKKPPNPRPKKMPAETGKWRLVGQTVMVIGPPTPPPKESFLHSDFRNKGWPHAVVYCVATIPRNRAAATLGLLPVSKEVKLLSENVITQGAVPASEVAPSHRSEV